jgi:hypothetical protein
MTTSNRQRDGTVVVSEPPQVVGASLYGTQPFDLGGGFV